MPNGIRKLDVYFKTTVQLCASKVILETKWCCGSSTNVTVSKEERYSRSFSYLHERHAGIIEKTIVSEIHHASYPLYVNCFEILLPLLNKSRGNSSRSFDATYTLPEPINVKYQHPLVNPQVRPRYRLV